MIITDDFVLLNYPKTGTTFVRKLIKELYSGRYEELLFSESYNLLSKKPTQHGTFSSIPLEFRSRQVVSIFRNPFDRYVSLWKFRWYSHSPPEPVCNLLRFYPSFPELSFEDFLEMTDRFSKRNILLAHGIDLNTEIGFQTIQFFAFYSADPRTCLLELLTHERNDTAAALIPSLTFLRQDSLRSDLKDFLKQFGFDEKRLAVIDTERKLNVSRTENENDCYQFWSNDNMMKYADKEKMLLSIFPEYHPIR